MHEFKDMLENIRRPVPGLCEAKRLEVADLVGSDKLGSLNDLRDFLSGNLANFRLDFRNTGVGGVVARADKGCRHAESESGDGRSQGLTLNGGLEYVLEKEPTDRAMKGTYSESHTRSS